MPKLTHDQLLSQKKSLLAEIRSIERQLKDRNRLGPERKRLSSSEYGNWRFNAKKALEIKLARYREIKQEIVHARNL